MATTKAKQSSLTSIKVKFRPSTRNDKEGTIYYQVIHNRIVRQQKSCHHIFAHEWDPETHSIVCPANSNRSAYLRQLQDRIDLEVKRICGVISSWDSRKIDYTTDDIIAIFQQHAGEQTLYNFMYKIIINQQQMGKLRTSETYNCTLRSFMMFRQDRDVLLKDINSDLMVMYESYLRNKGLTKNSTSFYMRILRAVYNRAIEKELTPDRHPFKYVYTGIDKTTKRAIPLKTIKQIKNLDLSQRPSLEFARDMFLFSFYTRGMSFIDMAYLRKRDLTGKVLSYRRRKTNQQLYICWEGCMQQIVERYDNPYSDYLLPLINPQSSIDERKQYIYAAHNINRSLRIIGQELGLSLSLTMYIARHSWASIAKSKNVPLSVISEGMGHDSEATTRIYLASLDTMAVDKANSMILKSL